MLWKLISVPILLVMVLGCRHGKPLKGDHPEELVGTWRLLIRSSCSEFGVTADTLVLHANGTFDQHVTSNGGRQIDATSQRWEYEANGSKGDIVLDKRLEFFTPEYFGTRIGEGAGMREMLIVEINSEPVILLHPDSDCVYHKVRRAPAE